MQDQTNPFATKKGFLQTKEKAQKFLLIFGTYSIIFFTLFVFWEILSKGAPVLYQYGTDFITRKPESLEVLAFDAGDKLEIPKKSYKTLKTYNPDNNSLTGEESFDKSFEYTTFNIEKGSVLSDAYLSEISKYNKVKITHLYRDEQAPVVFEVLNNTPLLLTPALYKKLANSSEAFKNLSATPSKVSTNLYEVTFKEKSFYLQAKTMALLADSSLIYKLYGNLTDTLDDKPNELMEVYIPENQTVLLTEAQHQGYLSDTGTGKFGEGKLQETSVKKIALTLPKGSYELPHQLFSTLLKNHPALATSHQHSLAKAPLYFAIKSNQKELRLPNSVFQQLKKDNPLLKLTDINPLTISAPFIRFNFGQACQIKLPTTDMSAFKEANEGAVNEYGQPRLNILNEYVYPYSSGGVSGPVIGTMLLVAACMIIALFVGVAAAVYLGEYAKNSGPLISTIRLSMMNLAGVPSIVFGLFGLGLFVSVAPVITSAPSIDDKFKFKIFPALVEPGLAEIEDNRIAMIEDDKNPRHSLRAAQQKGLESFYDGWVYLSFQGWGNSLIAGAFTLAIMVLPIIITSSEESLKAVPKGFREASLALGATKWQSIRTAVLPYATPGILTASVLGITRVAGETAPIMFTAAVAAKSDLPFSDLSGSPLNQFFDFMSQSVQALPYHIYTISGKLPPSEHIKPMQYGSVLVFMIIVMIFASVSIWLRMKMRGKIKW